MTRELTALIVRLVSALEEGNQLKRIEMRANGTLPNDGRGRRN
ncbi:hypothetical protein B0E53_04663 [Micromonospora sp. MH33]|nr:hypothetical protein [Micromonospora sp. MH33]PSK63416.1 hypothetical protein B0E53_04663 [Micromonospora sp. MH33]